MSMVNDQFKAEWDRIDRVILMTGTTTVTIIAVLVVACLAMLLTGCGTVQPGDVWHSVTNAVAVESQHSASGESSTPTSSQTTTTTTTTPSPGTLSGDYKITRVWTDGIQWTGPNMPASWPEQRADEAAMIERAGGPTCGEVHLKSSKGRAKFDHLRRDTKVRDWKNIHNGYGAWRQWGEPAQGEACELWACNYAQTEWVLIGGFKWVR